MTTYYLEYSYSHTPWARHNASFDTAFRRALEIVALSSLGVTIHRQWESAS